MLSLVQKSSKCVSIPKSILPPPDAQASNNTLGCFSFNLSTISYTASMCFNHKLLSCFPKFLAPGSDIGLFASHFI